MHCNHCDQIIETKETGLISCPHCNWKVVVNSSYNTNDKDIKNLDIEYEYWDKEETKIRKKICKYNNQLHNDHGPAILSYHLNGKVKIEIYYINGKYHRLDGPACIEYYENGDIESEDYFINDKRHRTDGPAYVSYFDNGNKKYETYNLNGKKHNDHGLAVINYVRDGASIGEYWIMGKQYTEKEFKDYQRRLNYAL